MAQTMEQKRAADAWSSAQAGVGKYGKDYVNEAKGLPALIMGSGLMQVMAFLQEKGGRQNLIAQQLRDWLSRQCGTPPEFPAFMQDLFTTNDARRFQQITSEAFAWLRWLRQMAPAVHASSGE